MPWNEANRERYSIVRERYTSDLSDEEYALIEPLLPQPKRLVCAGHHHVSGRSPMMLDACSRGSA
jgi:hypothetical protein